MVKMFGKYIEYNYFSCSAISRFKNIHLKLRALKMRLRSFFNINKYIFQFHFIFLLLNIKKNPPATPELRKLEVYKSWMALSRFLQYIPGNV